MAVATLCLAFSAATHDIAVDAYRIDIARDDEAVLTATVDTLGNSSVEHYDYSAWANTYYCLAVVAALAWPVTLMIAEPQHLHRRREGNALPLLLLFLVMALVFAKVFYTELGFSKVEIGNAVGTFGLIVTILGSLLGSALVAWTNLWRVLFLAALLSALSNLVFVALNQLGHNLPFLYVAITVDNLAGGMANAALLAFLGALTNIRFTATQYALFSSLMTLFPKLFAGYAGTLVDKMGYDQFFMLTCALGLPLLFLIRFMQKRLQL